MSDEHLEAEAPKRELTPEHKAKMAEGRERARQQRSRGRSAERQEAAPLPMESSGDPNVDDLERQIRAVGDGSGLTRQPRGSNDATFDIPMQGRLPGWDYEYKTVRVNGEEIDPSNVVEYEQGGWRLVPKSHFPSLVPPSWKYAWIERYGMRLYMRPERLSQEARDEQLNQAFEVRQAQLAKAAVGDVGVPGMARVQGHQGGLQIGREAPPPKRQQLL